MEVDRTAEQVAYFLKSTIPVISGMIESNSDKSNEKIIALTNLELAQKYIKKFYAEQRKPRAKKETMGNAATVTAWEIKGG